MPGGALTCAAFSHSVDELRVRISIVIPAFNEERLIGETLRQVNAALPAFLQRGWETELIVCDNNSTDRTAELARAAGAKVVFEPINQISRARNSGAQAATGDWLIFVDADSHPARDLFDEVAGQIQSGNCLGGGCTIKMDGHYRAAEWIAQFWNWLSLTFRLLAGSFIFCDAAVFRQVGGFSEELFAGEELDLTQKLKRLERTAGRRLIILRAHPLVTSARKIHLYTSREHFWFLLQASLSRKKVLRSRAACRTWYDGRR